MEDAMILNKSSYERGFAHASVYKTKVVDLADEKKRTAGPGAAVGGDLRFGNHTQKSKLGKYKHRSAEQPEAASPGKARPAGKEAGEEEQVKVFESLDEDGLPHIGDFIQVFKKRNAPSLHTRECVPVLIRLMPPAAVVGCVGGRPDLLRD